MNAEPRHTPSLYTAACIIFYTGAFFVILTLLSPLNGNVFKGFVYISLALIAFGAGEMMNHPKKEPTLREETLQSSPRRLPRERNACTLGNLCDIFSLLLFFAGVGTLISGR